MADVEQSRWHKHAVQIACLACAIAAVSVAFAIIGMYVEGSRIEVLEKRATNAEAVTAHLAKDLSVMRDDMNTRIGAAHRHIESRTKLLRQEEKDTASRLEAEQKAQLTAVAQQVEGVRSEVGAVKTDVSAARTDLEATKAKLERAIGDLGVQSGLIARTRDDLEALRHNSDRNYYEFTLKRDGKSKPVGTISLQLRKLDQKRSRFTLNVIADDLTIEKKDRTLNEPLQFYCGRNHQLYELVVNSMARNQISGYLSTPKDAPTPIPLSQ